MTVTGIEVSELTDLFEGEAKCEAKWAPRTAQCGKPAAYNSTGHNSDCTIVNANLCAGCVERARELGLLSPHIYCNVCGDSPIIKSVRPI